LERVSDSVGIGFGIRHIPNFCPHSTQLICSWVCCCGCDSRQFNIYWLFLLVTALWIPVEFVLAALKSTMLVSSICFYLFCIYQNQQSRFGIERHPYTKSRIGQILCVCMYVYMCV